jgi:predicted DNA-binding protein (MmcQ/YjbR family)
MNIEEVRDLCLTVKGVEESTPFIDPSILVFKVMGKIFAYVGLEPKDGVFRAVMKCNPERSVELRERYAGVTHATHTKADEYGWNAVSLDGDVPDSLIIELLHHSVAEVVGALSKKKQQEYAEMKLKS